MEWEDYFASRRFLKSTNAIRTAAMDIKHDVSRAPGPFSVACWLPLFVIALCLAAPSVRAAEPAANSDPPLTTNQASRPREALRYSGRTFDDWRDQLVNDLEGQTRFKAMPAIVAFGRHGYADEAAAALGEALDSDEDQLVSNAANHLVLLGEPAVRPLLEALRRKRPNDRADVVRRNCIFSLGRLGPRAAAAADVLREFAEHGPARVAALEALATVTAGDAAFQPLFKRLLDDSDEYVRRAAVAGVASGLLQQDPESVTLLVKLADDADPAIRRNVALALAMHGPAEKPVIETLQRLLRDDDQEVCFTVLNSLVWGGNRPGTVVPVLVDALTAPELLERVVGSSGKGSRPSIGEIIDVLGRADDQAALAVPILIDVVDDRLPELGPEAMEHAIDALAKLGPAAKDAAEVLERRALDEPTPAAPQQVAVYATTAQNQASLRSHARRALRKINRN